MSYIIERSEIHATFVVERSYPVPVTAVWHALSDNDARDQWFGGGAEFDVHEKSHDFRVGGHGVEDGQWRGGPTSRFVSTYTDIVEEQRMVFAYDMWVDDRHISTSLTTIAVEPDGEGTRLTYTEQGVHLDGLDMSRGEKKALEGYSTTSVPSSPAATDSRQPRSARTTSEGPCSCQPRALMWVNRP